MCFGHGGRRPGAGRPKVRDRRTKTLHRSRVRITRRDPVHVTLRAFPGVVKLRQKALFDVLKEAFVAGKDRFGCRLVHFSVQGNHLHLILEAESWLSVSRAIKGLSVRIARAVNRVMNRKGRVFSDRYNVHVLKTPREARNGVAYVLQNWRKHAAEARVSIPRGALDPFSSARWFQGWAERAAATSFGDHDPVVAPRTWLLTTGWRRHGLIRVDERPKPRS